MIIKKRYQDMMNQIKTPSDLEEKILRKQNKPKRMVIKPLIGTATVFLIMFLLFNNLILPHINDSGSNSFNNNSDSNHEAGTNDSAEYTWQIIAEDYATEGSFQSVTTYQNIDTNLQRIVYIYPEGRIVFNEIDTSKEPLSEDIIQINDKTFVVEEPIFSQEVFEDLLSSLKEGH